MYAGDSFFTLTPGGQAGLVALSGVLGLAMVWLTWWLTRRRGIAIRLAVWAVLFVAYLWLSPQVYYFYYRLIIDGLPLQWVIGPWPDPGVIGPELFPARRSMAADARAALGITMLLAALASGLDRGRRHTHQDGTRGQGRTK